MTPVNSILHFYFKIETNRKTNAASPAAVESAWPQALANDQSGVTGT
jgi:hypothetical protein